MTTDILPLVHGFFYHIYNRGNNGENIFPEKRNYAYFMELWWKHISPIAETWAWCLLKNHFHAAVYIKEEENLSGFRYREMRKEHLTWNQKAAKSFAFGITMW